MNSDNELLQNMGNVILIGFMGCGKSTVGLRLSYRLRQPVIDTDKEIERTEKRSISDIFAKEGEEAFRTMETKCLERMLDTVKDKVISVGGGLPMRKENRELLGRLGKVIFLRATPDTIWERLQNDTSRPLLQGENPYATIRELMQKREPFYEEAADVILDVDGKEFDLILDEIVQALER